MNTDAHYPNGRPTRDQALDAAAQTLVTARATAAQRTPREQAEAAWHVGSPYTVDELEDRIRARRGLEPLRRSTDV